MEAGRAMPDYLEPDQYLADKREIERLPDGADTVDLPERLRASAERMRRARSMTYPPVGPQQLATLASLLGMRTRPTPKGVPIRPTAG